MAPAGTPAPGGGNLRGARGPLLAWTDSMRRAGPAESSGAQSTSPRPLDISLPGARTLIWLLGMAAALGGALSASRAEGAPLRDPPRGAVDPADARATATAGSAALRYNGTIRGLDAPFAAAVNRLSRKIYVTEPNRNRVVVFDRLGRRRGSFGAGLLRRPTALAFDFSGNLAVVSAGAREIVLFRPGGTPIARADLPALLPVGLAFEPISRRLLVSDAAADSVWTSRDGRTWAQERPAGLSAPVGVAAAGGHFFVVSSTDTRLMELTPTGRLFRALPLRGARRPLGVTIPPFGSSLVVSSADSGSALFASQIGGPLTAFGGEGRMDTPFLPGSECTRVAFPDFTGDRLVVFNLPDPGSCTQGLTLRGAVAGSRLRRIVAPVVAENDSVVLLSARLSVPAGRGRAKRYRLRPMRTSLSAGIEKKLRLRVPARAAAGIRAALAQRRRSTARLSFAVRNRAGDRRRVVGRLVYSPRALAGSAALLPARGRP